MADKNIKHKGQVYTPNYIVKIILDLSGYETGNIIGKHVIDNSCGDGAFLSEIVTRYFAECKKRGYDNQKICSDLEEYVHGIEIDEIEYKKCIENMDVLVSSFGLRKINWDIICADSLTVSKYNGKMDFVLGNPPYVRVHNLGESFEETKSFFFSQKGMTDLYITFFEIGIKMLNKTGVLGYITPSSYFTSIAASSMRKFIDEKNLLDIVVNLKHYQPFEATTYTAITILSMNRKKEMIDYYEFDEEKLIPIYSGSLSRNDFYMNDNFYFGDKVTLSVLQNIFCNLKHSSIEVKNGFATLCDSVFVHDFDFESKYIIPVIKASTGEKKKIFYPYDECGNLIPESLLSKDKKLYTYLVSCKDSLVDRSLENEEPSYWYSFGRSQGIKDTYVTKLAVNALLRNKHDWKFNIAPSGVGIYSGLYIVPHDVPIEKIISVLNCDDFISYITILGKYKSGGYYTFSSKDLKAYLDYKLTSEGDS